MTAHDTDDARRRYLLTCCRLIPGGEADADLVAAAVEGQVHSSDLEQLCREGALVVEGDRYRVVASAPVLDDGMSRPMQAQLVLRLLARVCRWYCGTLVQCAAVYGSRDWLHDVAAAKFGDEGRHFGGSREAAEAWCERDRSAIRATIAACDLREDTQLRELLGWLAYLAPGGEDLAGVQARLGAEADDPRLAAGLLMRAARSARERGELASARWAVQYAKARLEESPLDEDDGAQVAYRHMLRLVGFGENGDGHVE